MDYLRMDRMARQQKQSCKQRPWRLPDGSVDESHPIACAFCAADVGHRTSTHFFCRIQKLINKSSANLVSCTSRTSRSHSPTGTPTGSIFCFSCIVCAFTLSRSQHSQWKQLEQAGEVTLWIFQLLRYLDVFQNLSSTYLSNRHVKFILDMSTPHEEPSQAISF